MFSVFAEGLKQGANMFIGLLIYIPGFSEEGILLALAGGSNETFVSAYLPLVS